MSKQSFILITFRNGADKEHSNEELEAIIEHVERPLDGEMRGASAGGGAINIYKFESNSTIEQIESALKSHGIKFLLTAGNNYDLPEDLNDFFESGITPESRKKPASTRRLSLEEQLNAAITDEDYEMAALLRDRLNPSSFVKIPKKRKKAEK